MTLKSYINLNQIQKIPFTSDFENSTGYFDGVFGDFRFPDGTKPSWETLSWLQKKFMKWFNEERTKYVLTFPVETAALLTDDKDVLD